MAIQKTLRAHRIDLGLSMDMMAKECGLTREAVTNAELGRKIRPSTAKKIADYLTERYGETILPSNIDGLNIA